MNDINSFLQSAQPIVTVVVAILDVGILAIIVNLARLQRDAQSERIEALRDRNLVTEERRLREQEDRIRIEKERDALRQRLNELLASQNVTTDSLVANPSFLGLKEDVTRVVESVLKEMLQLDAASGGEVTSPEQHLEMAKGFTVAGQWLRAAESYDKYVAVHPHDWEIHFLRAVAYANSRHGNDSDLTSLRAYGDAIALVPSSMNPNVLARLYTYRAAMLKRLGRLEEAESELLLARTWATNPYETNDNRYNLACVYAMKGEKAKTIAELRRLFADDPRYRSAVRARPEYFRSVQGDPEYVRLLQHGSLG